MASGPPQDAQEEARGQGEARPARRRGGGRGASLQGLSLVSQDNPQNDATAGVRAPPGVSQWLTGALAKLVARCAAWLGNRGAIGRDSFGRSREGASWGFGDPPKRHWPLALTPSLHAPVSSQGRGRQPGGQQGGARGGGGKGGAGEPSAPGKDEAVDEAPPRPPPPAGGGSGRSRSQVICHVFGCGEVINFADAGVKRSNLRYRCERVCTHSGAAGNLAGAPPPLDTDIPPRVLNVTGFVRTTCARRSSPQPMASCRGARAPPSPALTRLPMVPDTRAPCVRWCHKCSRLHDLTAFSQGRRTCAKVLKSLVARRRTVAADGRAAPQAPSSGGAAAPRRAQPKQARQAAAVAQQQLQVAPMHYPFNIPGYLPSMTGLPMMHTGWDAGAMLGAAAAMGPGAPMWPVPPGGALGGGDAAGPGLHLHLMASALSSYAQWLLTQPGGGVPGPGPGPPHAGVAGLVNMPPPQVPLVLQPVPPLGAPAPAGQQGGQQAPMSLQQWLLSQVAGSSPPPAPQR